MSPRSLGCGELGWCAGALLLAALGCSGPEPKAPSGVVGVFFGGQVQELAEIEIRSERVPSFGFRLALPGDTTHRVRWEITRPGPLGRRVVEQGSSDLRGARATYDQPIALTRESPRGTWNVRVTVDEVLVVDRALVIKSGSP